MQYVSNIPSFFSEKNWFNRIIFLKPKSDILIWTQSHHKSKIKTMDKYKNSTMLNWEGEKNASNKLTLS